MLQPSLHHFTHSAVMCSRTLAQIQLDGIVTLVDAKNVLLQLDGSESKDPVLEVEAQLAYADRILLNKQVWCSLSSCSGYPYCHAQDLVTQDERNEVEQRVGILNPTAQRFWTEKSKVDLDKLLSINAFRSEIILRSAWLGHTDMLHFLSKYGAN